MPKEKESIDDGEGYNHNIIDGTYHDNDKQLILCRLTTKGKKNMLAGPVLKREMAL